MDRENVVKAIAEARNHGHGKRMKADTPMYRPPCSVISEKVHHRPPVIFGITFQLALFRVGVEIECLQRQAAQQGWCAAGQFRHVEIRLPVHNLNEHRLIDAALDDAIGSDDLAFVEFAQP